MLPWQIWLIISGVCFIAEIATVGFLVFWFGVAALITCLLSLFISNVIAQTVIFVILSVILICLTRPFAEKMNKNDNIVTNSNAIIGKEGEVTKTLLQMMLVKLRFLETFGQQFLHILILFQRVLL